MTFLKQILNLNAGTMVWNKLHFCIVYLQIYSVCVVKMYVWTNYLLKSMHRISAFILVPVCTVALLINIIINYSYHLFQVYYFNGFCVFAYLLPTPNHHTPPPPATLFTVRKFNWWRYCLAWCNEIFYHIPLFDETLRHLELCISVTCKILQNPPKLF